jgi:outer membrane protein assembly factor BamB
MEADPISGDPMGSPCIGDMDGDGNDEVLFTGRNNNLYCVNAADGTEKWIFESAGKDEAVCLYDVTGDNKKEAV